PLLRDKNVDFRTRATEALGGIRSSERAVVEALLRQVASGDEKPRYAALAALKKGGLAAMKAALPSLVWLAKAEKDWRWRGDLVLSFPKAGPVAVPHLVATLGDPNVNVQMEAVQALAALGQRARAAIPALVALLKKNERDTTHDLLSATRDALAAMG